MADNLVAMLAASVHRYGDHPALWQPDNSGGYRCLTYAELWRDVERIGARLREAGVGRGDRVGLMAHNGAWWPTADFAIMGAGAVTVPVYPNASPGQARWILRHAGARGVIVQDGRMLETLLSAGAQELPDLEFAVVVHPGLHGKDVPPDTAPWRVYDWEQWQGTEPAPASLAAWVAEWERLERSDVATIVYTSGTTGQPKGAMLTHGNILSNIEAILQVIPLGTADRTLSYLPLSHIFERTAGQFVVLAAGGTIAYARGVQHIQEDFVAMPPDVLTTVPRLLEKIYEKVMLQVSESPAWRRRLFEQAVAYGRSVRVEGERKSGWRLALYDRLVFRKLKQATGGRLRMVVVGGAPLPPHVGRFFAAAGFTVVEGYGMTETSPVISVNRPERPRIGTAGPLLPGVEARIAADGELWVRGPNVMLGYYRDEEATRQVMTEDGWLKTGDIAEWAEGDSLRITDRKKHVIVLSTGKKVIPAPVEAEMLRSPLIDQVLLVGQGRKFVSAVVVPSESALAQPEGLAARLLGEVERCTAEFADFERPKRIIVAREPFTVENGMLTPTLKVRAKAVVEAYAKDIARVYGEPYAAAYGDTSAAAFAGPAGAGTGGGGDSAGETKAVEGG
ncbi:MAG: long-chain fatty acid--CoA ligase [Alicyclobacillus sp.]|nr:long-chain fatty acid--CoA ligase [Alicyclobacillus sp.]